MSRTSAALATPIDTALRERARRVVPGGMTGRNHVVPSRAQRIAHADWVMS